MDPTPPHPRGQPGGLRRALEEDHAALELLFEDMYNALRSNALGRANQVWTVFEARLHSHLVLEEEYILPAYAPVDPAEAAALREEHAQLRGQLRQLGESLDRGVPNLLRADRFERAQDAHAKREAALMYRFTEWRLSNERRSNTPEAPKTIATRLAEGFRAKLPAGAHFDEERANQAFGRSTSMSTAARVAEVMTCEVFAISESDPLGHVADSFERCPFNHMPVVAGRKLVGMLSLRDLLRSTVAGLGRGTLASANGERLFTQTLVREVMRSGAAAIGPDEPIYLAAELLLEEGLGTLPVVSGMGDLIGIVSAADLLRFATREGPLVRVLSSTRGTS